MPPLGFLQLNFSEYRERHIFTAKLRLAFFVGFWCLYLFFFHEVLGQLFPVTLTIAACFILTSLSYFWISRNRWVTLSIFFEILSDLIAITTIIYITEGPYSDFFTIYLFYIFLAGIFYTYRVALLIAVASAIFYAGFLLMAQYGWILPMIIDWGETIPNESHSPGFHYFFFAVCAVLSAYGVKVASYFSQSRERMLEARNKELSALTQMSSTIRSTISIEKVFDQILAGLSRGLDVVLSVLVVFDPEKRNLRLLFPKGHSAVRQVTDFLGVKEGELSFTVSEEGNPILHSLKHAKMIFREGVHELLVGLTPNIRKEKIDQMQRLLGIRKMIAVSLVAEGSLIGSLVCFTKEEHIGDQTVTTLESFANQASLTLEAAFLIQKLRKANEDLIEANRVKSEFLATMSHELRTPLTAIIGFSELLLEGVMGPLEAEQEDSLKEVLNNGATLLEMINNLLDMAKVEAGKMALEIEPFDIRDLVHRLTQTIGSLVQRKNLHLELILPDEMPLIHGDEKKIQHVLLNLLSNAVKFTSERGSIRIEAAYLKPKESFQISVADNGIGITDEMLPKIFEMFSQADSSVTRSHGGTGLGLALAKQFTEMHGGEISVESRLGKGTKFTVILPRIMVS